MQSVIITTVLTRNRTQFFLALCSCKPRAVVLNSCSANCTRLSSTLCAALSSHL